MIEKKEIRVKFEIGEIKFEAEGAADLVERERSIFNNTFLPAAIDAIVRMRGVVQNTKYSETLGLDQISSTTPTNMLMLPETPTSLSTDDFSRTSLVTFVKEKGAHDHYDFIICAAYYNEKKNGISSFSSVTLKELYSEAKKPLPGNLSQSLSELVKKGLIMEDSSAKGSNPKIYVLTVNGEEAVQAMVATEQKGKKSVTKPKKQRQKMESSYSGLNCDELDMSKYPEIRKLKEFKEKMMLILYIITNEGKGEWFTTTDVLFIMTDILGENATKDQVNGVFKREKRWFKAETIDGNKKMMHRKLLNEGKAYAQSLGKEGE